MKVDVAIGFGDDGITWEKDPAKHRKMAKDLSPSFSVKSLKALEPTMHKYIDTFVRKMKVIGSAEAGIELKTVCSFLPPPPLENECLEFNYGANLNTCSGRTGLRWTWRPT